MRQGLVEDGVGRGGLGAELDVGFLDAPVSGGEAGASRAPSEADERDDDE